MRRPQLVLQIRNQRLEHAGAAAGRAQAARNAQQQRTGHHETPRNGSSRASAVSARLNVLRTAAPYAVGR